MPKPTPNQWVTTLLIAILVYAAVLRITGLGWGLPNTLHYFSYHPDESVVVMHATPYFGGMNVLAGQILPHFYNYGTLQLYLIGIVVGFAHAYGAIGSPIDVTTGSIDPVQWAKVYYAARWITVVMGIGTVWATYALGRRLWGNAAGLIAALALTIMPLHVQHSHFVTVDVPATFWVTLSLLWAAKAMPKKPAEADQPANLTLETAVILEETPSDIPAPLCSTNASQIWFKQALPFILSGMFAGLATATKYNCALVIVSLLVAGHFAAYTGESSELTTRRKRVAMYTVAGLVAAAAAFFVGCPGALLEHAQFIQDLRFESDHVYHHPEIYFQQTGPGWWYIVNTNLSAALGGNLSFAVLLSLFAAAAYRNRGLGLLGVFALPYFALVCTASSRYARYEIPILPIIALLVGQAVALPVVVWFRESLEPGPPSTLLTENAVAIPRPKLQLWVQRLAFLVLWVIWWSGFIQERENRKIVQDMNLSDHRDQAYRWLVAQPDIRSSTIGYGSTPWFWTPPFNPYFTHPQPGKWTNFASPQELAHYVFNPVKPFDEVQLAAQTPNYVVLSEYEYKDRIRLRDHDTLAYFNYLQSHYTLKLNNGVVRNDSNQISTAFHPLGTNLPHDMLYTCPDTSVWVRNDIQEPAAAK